MVFFTTLEPHDQDSEVRYTVTGSNGERTLTVEWYRWHLSNGPAVNFASWQVSLEQSTGIITVHIGPNSGGGPLFTNSSGPNCGIFYSPVDFSSCYEKIWVEGSPDAIVVDSAANFDFDALLGFPDANTMYRFTPRFAITGIAPAPLLSAPQLEVFGTQLSLHWPSAAAPLDLLILDATGRAVQHATSSQTTWNHDVQLLSPGVYLLRARSGGVVFTARFIRP
ncbi:MAG: T9SS type A sorting domain-containing protein [Flavobacteriales bacterium]|nr:T9SS type A sorting domain-containing protein [Flavobacteriales bacterium]